MNSKRTLLSRALTLLFVVVLLVTYIVPVTTNAASFNYANQRSVINSITLHPQTTGFKILDQKVASLISTYKSSCSDTYELILKLYDWLVYNVKYTTYKPEYPYYDFSSVYKCPVPYHTIYMAYAPLFNGNGVCDNFSSAFCIMARAVGLDVYTCSGTQVAGGTTYSHVWCEMYLNGETYVFDPQADNSVYARGRGNNHYYFCRPYSNMGNTSYHYGSVNAKLKSGFISTTANRTKDYSFVYYSIGGNGSVSTNQVSQSSAQMTARSKLWNEKNYSYQFQGWLKDTFIASNGTTATLTATPKSGASFIGWYVNNKLVSTSKSYSFSVQNNVTVEAIFSGYRYNDIKSGSWYETAAKYCINSGIMTGTTMTTFTPDKQLTRAELVVILGRMKGINTSYYTTKAYDDVSPSSWYGPYVDWAKSAGITSGTNAKMFSPNQVVTREQMCTMFYNFTKYLGYYANTNISLSSYSDASSVHSWAQNAMKWAVGIGLIKGTTTTTLSPQAYTTRAQVAQVVMKFRQA